MTSELVERMKARLRLESAGCQAAHVVPHAEGEEDDQGKRGKNVARHLGPEIRDPRFRR